MSQSEVDRGISGWDESIAYIDYTLQFNEIDFSSNTEFSEHLKKECSSIGEYIVDSITDPKYMRYIACTRLRYNSLDEAKKYSS